MKPVKVAMILGLLLIISCKKDEKVASSAVPDASALALESYADSIEASINGISGSLDDAGNESVIAQSKSPSLLENLFLQNAYAATCSRALTHLGSGVCTRNVNCDYGAYLWSGTVQMTYANGTSCVLGAVGDSMTRTTQFLRTGPRGTLQTTTSSRTAWDGSTIGGGITVSKVDNTGAVEVDILGQHKILTRTSGSTVFDMSYTTPVPLQLNQIMRSGRVISSGTIEIKHNRAKYTAIHALNNLSYSSTYCYPTSGSISSTFSSGTLSGTGTVSFNGRGNFIATFNGHTKSFKMENCE